MFLLHTVWGRILLLVLLIGGFTSALYVWNGDIRASLLIAVFITFCFVSWDQERQRHRQAAAFLLRGDIDEHEGDL